MDPPDAILFTSPSTVRAFLQLSGAAGRAALEGGHLRIVTIGPTTSDAVREVGLSVAAEAISPGSDGLVGALMECLGES